MSNALISFIASLGAATWVFNKMQRQTGGNTSNSLIVAGIAAAGVFVVLLLLLSMVPSN